uniref:Uncharacterized protein n=1 Tax=Setaria viridis TaxID=4556 RepID=A0A4U6VIL8_SETVI|nr:hypothetical protein SEVIR_3G313603v2 [Setaria viridis]
MDFRALLPNRSGSPSATLSASSHSRPRWSRQGALSPPWQKFAAAASDRLAARAHHLAGSPTARPDAFQLFRRVSTVAPPTNSLRDDSSLTNPDSGRDSSFSALPELCPGKPLLPARPRSRSSPCLFTCCNLACSTILPVTPIKSAARRRPPPPNLNPGKTAPAPPCLQCPMAEDAISEVLFCRPSPLNRRHGSALPPSLLVFVPLKISLFRAAIKRERQSSTGVPSPLLFRHPYSERT